MSVHQTAYYIGIIISGYAAGYIGQLWGWRSAFYVFGAIGVIHGIVMAVRLKDKREEPSKAVAADSSAPKPKLLEGFRMVFTTPTALILTVCFAGLIFVLTGYLTWMPTYLFERFDMDLSGAGFHSMFYTHLFAFFGVLLAGRLSDKLGRLHPAWRMAMQGFGLLAAVPFILLMGNSATLWVIYVGFAGFGIRPGLLRRQYLYGALRRHPAALSLVGFEPDDDGRIRNRGSGSRGAGCREAGCRAVVRHLDAGRCLARVRSGHGAGRQTFLSERLQQNRT